MTPSQPQIIRKYTPPTHVRQCKAPWPFLKDKTTPLHMNALIWKGKSSRKMKGKKTKQTQARVCDQHVTFLSSLEHIQTHQKRGASRPVGGPEWDQSHRGERVYKRHGRGQGDLQQKKEGARWEGETLVVVWQLFSFPWVDLERKCHFQGKLQHSSGLLHFC